MVPGEIISRKIPRTGKVQHVDLIYMTPPPHCAYARFVGPFFAGIGKGTLPCFWFALFHRWGILFSKRFIWSNVTGLLLRGWVRVFLFWDLVAGSPALRSCSGVVPPPCGRPWDRRGSGWFGSGRWRPRRWPPLDTPGRSRPSQYELRESRFFSL